MKPAMAALRPSAAASLGLRTFLPGPGARRGGNTQRSNQPAGSTMGGIGIPPPRQLDRDERLVARPRGPPHGRPAIFRPA